MRFGLIGSSYTMRSKAIDVQRTMNLFPELIESGMGKSKPERYALHGTPGLELFATLGLGPIRGMFVSDEDGGRMIVVSDDTLYNVSSAGVATSLGTVEDVPDPASIAYNGTQYLIISGTSAYILEGSTLTEITDSDFPDASQVVFMDGYFIVIQRNSQNFRISDLYDGTAWNALDFSTVEASPDQLVSIFADHSDLWLFGADKTEVFENSGDADFPFTRIPGAIVEQGCLAPFSVAKVGQSLMWLGSNFRGAGTVWASQGYTAQRVSTHAVEFAIQGYTSPEDAVAYSYQEEGHEFYVLTFVTDNATWVYDITTGLWHERGYWNPPSFEAHRGKWHVYAFGKHLVGDHSNGKIYESSLDTYDDDGDEIKRLRIAPHISHEHQWIFHSLLHIDMQVGVGVPGGQGADPQMMMRFSDDGGNTWSNTQQVDIGQDLGYNTRVQFRRLGRSRDRVYEISITDPVKIALIDGYVEAGLG